MGNHISSAELSTLIRANLRMIYISGVSHSGTLYIMYKARVVLPSVTMFQGGNRDGNQFMTNSKGENGSPKIR